MSAPENTDVEPQPEEVKPPERVATRPPVRRHTRSTRPIAQLKPPPRNWGKLVSIVLAALGGLGALALGLQWYVKARVGRPQANKSSLYVVQVVGSPERVTVDGAKVPFTTREELKEGFHLEQSDGDRVTFTTGWGGRIVVAKKAIVDFSPVQLQPNRPQASRLQMKGKEGAILIDVAEGDPLFEIELPQGSVAYGGAGKYWISMDLVQSSIIVRDGLVRVRSGATSDTIRVTSEQRLLIDPRGEWKPPAYFPTAERVWQ